MARQNHEVTAEGVWFESPDRANKYADLYDKDIVSKDGGWLAKNRTTHAAPMPTKDGDVVIFHLHQMRRVWVTTWNGAQGPDPDVAHQDFWDADEAENAARKIADETGGQIYRLQKDGNWTTKSN